MGFHRLTVPSYAGGLRGGDDYINNAVAGVQAPADGALGAGTYVGSYFFARSDQVTAAGINRGIQAVANNCDILDDRTTQMVLDYEAADAVVMLALTDFEAELADDTFPGDTLVGSAAKTAFPYLLTIGTVASQLMEVVDLFNNEVAAIRHRVISANQVVDDLGDRDRTIIFSGVGGYTLTLPDPSVNVGREFWLIDTTGSLEPLSPTSVNLVPFGAELIEGINAPYLLTVANGRWRLWTEGVDWYLFAC